MVKKNKFFQLCERELNYLISDYGFSIKKMEDGEWGYKVVMKNQTTGIEVYFEAREHSVFLRLFKLVDDDIIVPPGEIRADTVLYGFDINDLLALRMPNAISFQRERMTELENIVDLVAKGKKIQLEKLSKEIGKRDTTIKEMITTHAINLQKYAQDILQGDFAVFTELDKIVKGRAKNAAIEKWGRNAAKFGWD